MFSSTGTGSSSNFAALQSEAAGQLLAVRVCLQQVLDQCNQFPVLQEQEEVEECVSELQEGEENLLLRGIRGALGELLGALEGQVPDAEGAPRKRKRRVCGEDVGELDWEQVLAPQKELQSEWEAVINREHARSHFGSEQKKSRLKVFNTSIWDQINDILMDNNRVIEKSRVPLEESERKRLRVSSDAENDNNPEDYDLEVYDDRHFYSQLLKSFIHSSTAVNNFGLNSGGISANNMRAEDLAALKKYRKKKSKVDRKASKGRKIRYVPHDKLKNFMFPIPYGESAIDVDNLFSSLFQ